MENCPMYCICLAVRSCCLAHHRPWTRKPMTGTAMLNLWEKPLGVSVEPESGEKMEEGSMRGLKHIQDNASAAGWINMVNRNIAASKLSI